jgi:FAD/FMN-containing dehydrogenase
MAKDPMFSMRLPRAQRAAAAGACRVARGDHAGLVGARVVTAHGHALHVTATENPDLFWAIRGGGNFGVVIEFEFALHAVGPLVHLGLFLFSPADVGDLFRFARDYVRTVPEDYGVFLAGLSAPPAPFVPPELHHTPAFGLLIVGFGDEASHAEVIAPITQALNPIVQMVTPIPYAALQQMFDESAPRGMHAYEKAVYRPSRSTPHSPSLRASTGMRR